jgi:uncharacterized protein involved in outer membrane biogenesis
MVGQVHQAEGTTGKVRSHFANRIVMTQIIIKTPPPRRGKWRRRILWSAGFVFLLCLGAYFLVTSNWFVQRVVLPQVSKALQADVTLAEANLSPWRHVHFRELKVHPKGDEVLLQVQEIRVRYSLLALLRGRVEVAEVSVESPVVNLVQRADGTSNLDALLQLVGKSDSEPKDKTTSTAPQVNIKLVQIKNGTLRRVQHHATGGADQAELSGLNFMVRDVKNGSLGQMELAAQLAFDKAAQADAEAGTLRAKLDGKFVFTLTPELQPGAIQGETTFAVTQATGPMAELAALGARLDCELTPTEITEIALRFRKDEAELGGVRLTGPFVAEQMEGKLKLELLTLDRRVLNLFGAPAGIDFGTSAINAHADIELARGGQEISIAGRVDLAKLQLIQGAKISPTLDLRCDYAVAVDQGKEQAVVKFLTLSGLQNAQLFLQSTLASPLTIGWGDTNAAVADATLEIALKDWKLADWAAFIGDPAPTGLVNMALQLKSAESGQQLQLTVDGGVQGFALTGGATVKPAEIRFQTRAEAQQLQQFKLASQRLEILLGDQSAFVATVTGAVNRVSSDADWLVMAQANLPQLAALAPDAGANFSSGKLNLTTRLVGRAGKQDVSGQVALTEMTGTQGTTRWERYGVNLDFAAMVEQQLVELAKFTTLVTAGGKSGGRLDAGGKFDFRGEAPSGDLIVRLVNFNEAALRPFLESALGDKKLVSVALHTTATVGLDATGGFATKASLQMTNLVVNDPKQPALATPLAAEVQLDVGMAEKILEVREAQVTLTPTERAKNTLNLTGTVNLTNAEAISGNLKLAAESLDLTRYYDLLMASTPAPKTSVPPDRAKPAPTETPAPAPEAEPEAIVLPVENFVFELAVGRLYLREVDIADLKTVATINGSKVMLQPCELRVNGAPISATADLDLGVPGYRYDVKLDVQSLPLTPVVNTFQPELIGQIGGHLLAKAELRGAGVTGASLQTNLVGQFDVLATNLNLSISHVRSPIATTIINVIVGLPELIRNPAALIGRRENAEKGGWSEEITAQPIQVVALQGRAGDGKITMQPAQIRSAAFQVNIAGDLVIAPVLTNSVLNFPVNIALGRRYAEKIGLVNASTPTNEVYIVLPDFLTVQNTMGAPKADISKRGIAAVLAKTSGGIAKELGLATGEQGKALLDAVGGLLSGKSAPTNTNTTVTNTNAPAEPEKKSGGLLDLFRRPKSE